MSYPHRGHDPGPLFEPAAGADVPQLGRYAPVAVGGQVAEHPELGRNRSLSACSAVKTRALGTDIRVEVKSYASTVRPIFILAEDARTGKG